MEENLLTPVPDFKIYKDSAIYVGTFLGGPLVAGYLTAENFKRLGHHNKVRTTWIITIAATIIIFACVLLIPYLQKLPRYIIPLIYTAITQYLVKHFQGEEINQHMKSGGRTYSIWRTGWIGLLGLIVTLAIIFIILLLTDHSQ